GAGGTPPGRGGRAVDERRPPVLPPPHGLRLHRSSEPRRPLPDVRLRRPGRHEPAAVRHHRAPAGPVPDEQPVLARPGPPAGRVDPPGGLLRPGRRHPPALPPPVPPLPPPP